MSWLREEDLRGSWLQRFCARVLKIGPIPKHVAIIMDGNRRFARKNSIESVQGHFAGFDRLAETLTWCLHLGITEVTVYAFSLENFKRPKDEVDGLMELARQKFTRLLTERHLLDKYGVCIRALGNLDLFPRDVQEIIARAVVETRNNNRAILNVCVAYTSRDEMCGAMRDMAEGVQKGLIRESDISESLFEKCLLTHRSYNPDLLMRTSGEVRLSDFILWQSTYSVLSFVKVLWPEFSVWHLYGGILMYQRSHAAVQAAIKDNNLELQHQQQESDYQCVLAEIQAEKEKGELSDTENVQERLRLYAAERQNRIETFLAHLYSRRDSFFDELTKCKPMLGASNV